MGQLSVASAAHVPFPGHVGADLLVSRPMRAEGRPPRKVLLVVSGRLFRDGLRNTLQAASMSIVGGCDTLAEAAEMLDDCDTPDLVVVGAQGGGDVLSDLTELHALRQRLPGTLWMVLCKMPVTDLLRDAVGAGIDGILAQDIPADILHHVVELMLLGHSLVPQEIAPRLASRQRRQPAAHPVGSVTPSLAAPAFAMQPQAADEATAWADAVPASAERGAPPASRPGQPLAERASTEHQPAPLPAYVNGTSTRAVKLSDREAEILQCLVNGASNKAIARDLRIAEATVKVHVKGLLRKMQLQNRTQAAIWALNNTHAARVSASSHLNGCEAAAVPVTVPNLQAPPDVQAVSHHAAASPEPDPELP